MQPITQPITRPFTRALDGFVAFLPSLVAGLVILALGYVIALVLSRTTRALLSRTAYDRFLARLQLLDRDRVEARSGSTWTGKAVFWLVMLVAAMQASQQWGLTMVGVGIGRVIAYLPHVLGAAFIFAAALYFGSWVRDRIAQRELTREGSQQSVVASAVRAGILALGAFMALRELQIAPEIVTLAFGVSVAAIGLAAALAFGLGSRDVAGRLTDQWYERRPVSSSNGHGPRRRASVAHPTTTHHHR